MSRGEGTTANRDMPGFTLKYHNGARSGSPAMRRGHRNGEISTITLGILIPLTLMQEIDGSVMKPALVTLVTTSIIRGRMDALRADSDRGMYGGSSAVAQIASGST